MSDPLSISASVITVIGSGFAIAKGLITLADGLGSAGESVRMYAKEIRFFSELLDTVREELEKDPKHSWSRAECLTMEILEVCKSLLEPTNQLHAKLNPLLASYRDSPKKLYNLTLRIRWIFSFHEKLLRYRGSLQALTLTLNTALVTIKFKARPRNPDTWYIEENLVQCIDDVRRLINDPRRLALGGFLQPIVQTLPPPDTGAAIMNGASTSSMLSLEARVSWRIASQAGVTLPISDSGAETNQKIDDPSNTIHDAGKHQALIRSPSEEDDSIECLENSNTNESPEINKDICDAIGPILYQQPDGVDQEIWEGLRVVSRNVLKYAEEVLHSASQTPSLSPNLQPDAPPKDAEAGSSDFQLSTKHGEVRIPGHVAQNFEISSGQDGISVVHKGNGSKPAPDVPRTSDLVTLKIFDNSYQVPLDLVREWKDAKSVFSSLHGEEVFEYSYNGEEMFLAGVLEEGEFVLKGSDGHQIIPRYWAQTVRPDSVIELQLSNKIFREGKNDTAQVQPVIISPPAVEDRPRAEGPLKLEDTPNPEKTPNEATSGSCEVPLRSSSLTESLEKPKDSRSAKIGRFFRRKR